MVSSHPHREQIQLAEHGCTHWVVAYSQNGQPSRELHMTVPWCVQLRTTALADNM